MKTPIGSTFMYNLIILFLVIVFAFLSGIMSYYKAFKINNRIVYIIEKFEGYNELARTEIDYHLTNFGYTQDTRGLDCTKYNDNGTITNINETNRKYRYCIYIDNKMTSGKHGSGEYYTYTVRTYLTLDLPFVEWIRIPITTKTNQIYKFTKTAPDLIFTTEQNFKTS
ncbi:MAG: hypothetical protein E7170_03260 [Firmicutes bacterium]|nr:hypothetical protein [Bacillota bacterium]